MGLAALSRPSGGGGDLDSGLARTLPGARIGAGTLSATGSPLRWRVPDSSRGPSAVDVHHTSRRRSPSDGESCDLLTQVLHVGL